MVLAKWVRRFCRPHFWTTGLKTSGSDFSGIPVTKKKFAELELSLLHLQQNVEIPEIHLIIHPVIQKAVEQVGA